MSIRVKLLKPRDNGPRAQIYQGSAAGQAVSLEQFTQEMRDAMQAAVAAQQWGYEVVCEHVENPTPENLRPAAQQPAAPPPQAHPMPQNQPPAPQPGQISHITGFHGQNARLEQFNQPQPWEKMGVADQVTGIRIQAGFRRLPGQHGPRLGDLVEFAPDIQPGLGQGPDVDLNPYNFAEWLRSAAWEGEAPARATHEREHGGRINGVIDVTFTAKTPIFVPASEAPGNFFKCWDGQADRFAIPGSSVKGAVRSLFEALTNSRCGVSDPSVMGDAPLYRRRSSRLFRVTRMPTATAPGEVEQCAFAFCNHADLIMREGDPSVTQQEINAGATTGVDWRANLYWVPSSQHVHGPKKKLHYKATPQRFPLTNDVLERYLGMRNHDHFEKHASRPNAKYAGGAPPAYATCKNGIFDIRVGSLIFGIVKSGQLHCFGKNVNFLWPAAVSPAALLGGFRSRKETEAQLAGSDPAELTFGFIGNNDGTHHPFRGRVRFTTFWANGQPTPMDPVRLMPLTSPSGTRCKSRPLYLAPGPNGVSSDYGDANAALRGRKFYWHQKAQDDGVPLVHRYDEFRQTGGPTVSDAMLPAPISPLPAETVFEGHVHFRNLTAVELGALLVSLNPSLAFGNGDTHGVKLGKGKPRGLGSVKAAVAVRCLAPAVERYRDWEAPPPAATDVKNSVAAYQAWAAARAGRPWAALEFVRDLDALLRLPQQHTVRVYPTRFNQYNWGAHWNQPDGEPPPAEGRRKAMRRAR